jgi:hypothetical protein
MSCINLSVTPVAPAVLGISTQVDASLTVEPVPGSSLSVQPQEGASISVKPDGGASINLTPQGGCTLTVGEVCSVTGGTLVVLAASDGPLRTRDGGYILLNPATNPKEN